MERLRRMTALIKYSTQNEETNKILFEKLNKLSNLEWAKWGGWFDSDGSFFKKGNTIGCKLELSDKSPVELFAKMFETTLSVTTLQSNYQRSTNTKKERFIALLSKDKAIYFCKKIHPYIINKNNSLNNLLKNQNVNLSQNYDNMTTQEFIAWLTCFIEGDGSFTSQKKYPFIRIYSNNLHLLNYIKKRSEKENIVKFNKVILKQKEGSYKMSSTSNIIINRKNGYCVSITGKKNLLQFYDKIFPFMTLDRKKQKMLEHIEMYKKVR